MKLIRSNSIARVGLAACAFAFLVLGTQQQALATATVTTLANASISADTAGGAYTALTGPVLDEGANRDISNTGALTLNSPGGFVFDTTATVTVTVNRLAGSGTIVVLSSSTATVSASAITVTISARDENDGTTRSQLVWSGIRVRPAAGTPLAGGVITKSGATISGIAAATSFGALTEVAGTASRLIFSPAPSGALYGTPFSTQPVVKTADQFGNPSIIGLVSSLSVSLALTTGVGPLVGTTTLDIGTAAGNGTAAFSGLRINAVENGDVITASASGLTAAVSAAFNVGKATLTASGIVASDKIYDRTNTATLDVSGAALVGVVPGDVVTLNTAGALGTFAVSNAGPARLVNISNLTIGGTDSGKYALTQPTDTADITPKQLTVNGITVNTKAYDATTAAALTTSGASLSGVIAGDSVSLVTGGAVGAFSDKNVGTGKSVAITALALSGTGTANYSLLQPTRTGNITARTLTVTSTGVNRVYNGTTVATVTLADNRIAGDVFTANYTAANFTSKTVGNNKTINVTGINLTGPDAANYNPNTTETTQADITAKGLTISGITANDKVYDRTTAATLNKVGAALVGVVAGDTVALNTNSATGTFSTSAVGVNKTVTIAGNSISGTDAGNYTLTQPTDTADITPKQLTVSGITVTARTYNATTAALLNASAATLSGVIAGDTVSLNTNGVAGTYADKNVGTGKSVAITGLTIGGAAAPNYSLLPPIALGDITARALAVTAVGVNRIYDGTVGATVTLADNRLAGDVFTANYTAATFATKTVGSGKTVSVTGISLSGTDAANYTPNTTTSTTANITVRALTVTASAPGKIYDRTTAASATLADDRVAGDVLTVAFTSATFADADAGVGKTVTVSGISLSGTDGANYSANGTALTTATITPKTLTVTGITASDKSYDGLTSATLDTTSAALVGVINPDVVTLSTESATGTFANANVEDDKTVTVTGLTMTGPAASNYSLAQPTATANITPAILTVTADNKTKVYGDAVPPLTVTYTGFVNAEDESVLSGAPDITTPATAGSPVSGSPYAIAVTAGTLAAANYSFSFVAGELTVTSVSLTASITASDKVYDGLSVATILTRTLTGLVGSDDVTLSGGTASFADKNVGLDKTVTATGFGLAGADAGNYVLGNSTALATASIAPRSLAVAAIAANKEYDGTTAASVNLTDDRVLLDVLSISHAAADFADRHVGIAKTVTVTGIVVGGTDSGNYIANTTAATAADITPRPLTVTAVTDSKVYDGTTASAGLPSITSGLLASGDIAVLTQVFDTKHSGTGKTLIPSPGISDGNGGNNYATTLVNDTTGSIAPRDLTISATAAHKVYDGNTTAVVSFTDDRIVGDALTINYGAASFADANVGNGKTVTVTGLSLSGLDGGNYTPNATAAALADITPVTLTVRADNKARPFGAANPPLAASYSGFVNDETVAVLSGQPALSTTADASSPLGTYPINISVGTLSALNYVFSFVDGTLTVGRATITVQADDQTRPYGSANAVLTASYSGFANGDTASVLNGAPLLSTTADATSPVAGSPYAIVVTQGTLSADNYDFAFVNGQLVVTQAVLTVTAENKTKVYGEVLPPLTVSYSGFVNGEDETVLSGTPELATAATATSSVTGGPYAITVTTGTLSADNYSFAFENGLLSVTPVGLTGSITASDKIYDGTAAATILTRNLSGVLGGEDVSLVGDTALFIDKHVGLNKAVNATGLSLAGSDAGNYALVSGSASTIASITPAALTISATASSKVYDANTSATVSLSDNRRAGDDLTVVYSTALFSDKNVGNGKTVTVSGLSISGLDAGNYTPNATATALADITPVTLTVRADDKARAFGAANPPLTASYSGFVNAETVAVLSGQPALSTTADASSPLGTYPINISVGTLSALNYVFSFVDGTLTVGRATITVQADDQTRPYGSANAVLTASYSGFANGDSASVLSGAPLLSTTADATSPVADSPYAIVVTQGTLSADNYDFAFVNGQLVVTQAVLTVTAENKTKVYGEALPPLTVSYSGFVNGEDETVLSGTPELATAADATSSVTGGPYPIAVTAGTLSADNYSFAFENGLLSVTPVGLTGSITASDKIYDGTAAATILTRNLSGVLGGEDVSLVGDTALFIDKHVGLNKAVNATGLSLAGSDAGNYALVSGSASTIASITPAALTISATASSKVYDANAMAVVSLIDDRQAGDLLIIGHPTALFSDKNVGTGKTVTVTGLTISGPDAGNYVANSSAFSTADITRRNLTIAATAASKLYDGNTTAVVSLTDNRIPGDALVITFGAANFAAANAGNGKTVTVTDLSVSGADAGNYSANTIATALANITAVTLTVRADNKTRVYGEANPALTASYSGFVNGDTASVLSGAPGLNTAADVTSSVAGSPYVIIASAGTLSAANYVFAFVNGALSITPAPLSVTVDDATRTFGAANPTFTGTIAVIRNGDNITATYATIATPASAAGAYPIVPTLLDPDNKLGNYQVTIENGVLTITPLPEISMSINASGDVLLSITCEPGLTLDIEQSTDLQTWTVLTTIPVPSGAATYTDVGGASGPLKFYRLKVN